MCYTLGSCRVLAACSASRAGIVDPVGFYGGFTPCSVDTLLDDERNTPAVGAVKNRYKATGMRNIAKPVKKIYIQWLFVLFS